MTTKKRITIRDVAREAGVSVKTVSRAINDHPDVSEATRLAVQEVARNLGFQPSSLARSLRSGRSGLIGLLVPDILDPHYAEQAQSFQKALREAGYVLIMSNTDYDVEVERAEIGTFIANRVDAIISLTGRVDAEISALVAESGIVQSGYNQAFYENEEDDQATYAAMRHLMLLGHRQFAYITQSLELSVVRERVNAFKHMLAVHNLPRDPRMIVADAYLQAHKLEGGYQAMKRLLESGYRPTAVCTSSDLIAIGVLRAVHEAGLRVPDDISIVGHGDILQASFTEPPLTTIKTPFLESGKHLVRHLLHQIDPEHWQDGEAAQADEEADALRSILVVRQSTGPAPGTPLSQLETTLE